MNNCINNISNGWIIGCSLLTCGIITSSYLHAINNIKMFHMKHKHNKQMKLLDINHEDQLISYYSTQYTIAFILGITGISIVSYIHK
jgi:hypothetical protein